MKKHNLFILIFILQFNHQSSASNVTSDSLSKKNYDYFINKINTFKKDTATAKIYAQAWLNKAKQENNWEQSAKAYRSLMYCVHKKHWIRYSDSLLVESLRSKNNLLIGNAFLTKGILYYDRKELKKALDYYIEANKYLALTKNQYAINKVKYSIAHTKYYLGFYDEAIALFNQCLVYFKEENDRAYLNTVHSLGLCYSKIKDYQTSSDYNKLGIEMSSELENDEMILYFNHSEGVNAYFKNNFDESIKTLLHCISGLEDKNDLANLTVANFYIAKSYWSLGNPDKSLEYLIQVDNAFGEQKYIRPDLRENYELLIQYYQKKGNKEAQLLYINKLLKADSLMNQNFKYLSKKIFKEFDTHELIEEKNNIERAKDIQQKVYFGLIASLLLVFTVLIVIHIQNRKKFKKRFEELLYRNAMTEKKPVNHSPGELNINPKLVEMILENLERFENSTKFLQKDLTITKLANLLNTNPKYAAKVIRHYRHKKSIDYISSLKIDYVVNLLMTESKYRNYTNTALADEVGFNTTQNFCNAFKKHTGLSPTYFIEGLKKIKQEDHSGTSGSGNEDEE